LLAGADLRRVQISASGGLDEYQIAGLLARGAPIAGFGAGTRLAVSTDAPESDLSSFLQNMPGDGRLPNAEWTVEDQQHHGTFRPADGAGRQMDPAHAHGAVGSLFC
jgi:hypothetical protein